ncbi:MAG: accessory Sec system translocase SecA2 [Bacillota bacterium]
MHILSGIGKLFSNVGEGLAKNKLKPYYQLLDKIKKINIEKLDSCQIKVRSRELIREAGNGASMDDLLVEAFALVCEASWRVLGIRPYDVQVIAGIALHQGNLVEMQTGEGKTLVAVLPAYLNALLGKGVHILAFNDYLARRDADWMGPLYRFLGLSAGFVKEGMSMKERRAAYNSAVTYVSGREAGFDYLRDSLCYGKDSPVHRPFNFAVADEADSILIDEARVPLVIAGKIPAKGSGPEGMVRIVRSLEYGIDYETDEYKRNVYLTEAGADKVEDITGCGNLYDTENIDLLTDLYCALHAGILLKRDVDYIIRNGRVELVDELTGRIADRRQWPGGLQAAVEAKEGLILQSEGRVLGSITLQHFLGLYPGICGMTATAQTSVEEFRETYSLEVVTIPPNRPCIRIDQPDVVFTHKEAKYKALIEEVVHIHATGRPILIGTASVEESDMLAERLIRAGIQCSVLNARNDEMEAEIIARAGEYGAVTVSTNMAGRGVDIRLGGGRPEEWAKVAGLGGLYVIGTNRFESVRVDNQLRGRAGRQGDPGSSRFFISLEDDLLKRFGIDSAIPCRYRSLKQDEPLEAAVINRRIDHVQRVVNGQNFDMRKTLNKYSYILEQQRRIIHKWRRDVLMNEDRLQLFSAREPERYNSLIRTVGRQTLQRAEMHITLFHIDRCWADYLDYVAYIREGIHLVSLSMKNPLDEFHKLVIKEFEELPLRIEREIIKTLKNVKITDKGIDLEREGLKSPSATWTYVVNDNHFLNKNIFGKRH